MNRPNPRPVATPRHVWRRVLAGAVMGVLGTGSAIVTAAVAHPQVRDTEIAYASNPPMLFSAANAPHVEPPAAPTAAPAIQVATGPCVSIPILVYHYIRVNPVPTDRVGWNLSVTPTEFQAQMDWLRQAGGHPMTLAQVMAALAGGTRLPAQAVVLTFDDGHDDFATVAAPILARDGFVAADYVVSGFLGRPGYMTAAQVQQVAAMGMVIGAHTVHHVALAALPTAAAAAEISASKVALEQLLGKPVLDFAYPYGSVNTAVASLVEQAGFHDAVTMNAGNLQCASWRYWLHRVRIGGSDNVWSFAAKAGIRGPAATWVDPGLPAPSPAPATPTPTPVASPSPSSQPTPTPTPTVPPIPSLPATKP